jgi:putative tricarboxylic transport membrane protein
LVAALQRIVTGKTLVKGETFAQFMAAQEFDHTWRKTADFSQFLADTDAQFGTILQLPEFAPVSSGRIGPMHFPSLLFVLLAVLVPVVVWQEARGLPATVAPASEDGTATTDGAGGSGLTNLAAVLAAVAVYMLLAETLGFVLTAGVLLFLLLWKFGNRVWTSLLISAVAAPAVYQLFAGLLRVPLPYGVWGW